MHWVDVSREYTSGLACLPRNMYKNPVHFKKSIFAEGGTGSVMPTVSNDNPLQVGRNVA